MPAPGDRFDRFVVESQLGRGGMASVYLVRHEVLGSAHALKVLDIPLPAIRNRLVLEGRLQAQAGHPNIVAVTDLIEVEGAPGLIMELVSGPTLDGWLATNHADAATADALFRGILDGVAHAHRQGLIHRDLKPANVLVATVDGRLVPKVSDFGLAKVFGDGGSSGTRTGFAMGTPGYMAPEQIRNAKDVDARADIFALGAILYEIWTGRPAFAGDDMFAILQDIEAGRYASPRGLRADLPESVERAIEGCLRADRAARIPDCDALRACLGGASLAEVRLTAPARPVVPTASAAPTFLPNEPTDAGEPAPSPPRRSAMVSVVTVAGVGIGGLVLVCAGVLGAVWLWGDPAGAPTDPPPVDPAVVAVEGAPVVSSGEGPSAEVPAAGVPSTEVPSASPSASPSAASTAPPAVVAPARAVPEIPSTVVERPPDPLSSPEPAAPPAEARFSVTGDADAVWLEAEGRRFGPGVVAPGSYAVFARFGEASVVVKSRLAVRAGDRLVVACDAAFSNCRIDR